MGQFATPPKLADQILLKAKGALGKRSVSFLDPALGTGSFYSSAVKTLGLNNIGKAVGFEIDPDYGKAASKIWGQWGLSVEFKDFTSMDPPAEDGERFDLVVCNPPYVRHHLIPKDTKERLQKSIYSISGVKISQLMGLYGIFLLVSVPWMKRGGLGCWLIPGEFLDVNYGRSLKRFLLGKVRLVQIHRFDPREVQFDDALVSSAVVLFENRPPQRSRPIEFSFGGNLLKPKTVNIRDGARLDPDEKWNGLFSSKRKSTPTNNGSIVRFGDIFNVKRGIATGANDFFILDPDKIKESKVSKKFLRPILPSPRSLKNIVVGSDSKGHPNIANPLYLLNVDISMDEVREFCPNTYRYLQMGIQGGINDRYLCKKRKLWYAQEKREPAPIMVTYMGRAKKNNGAAIFRFILNESNAIGANTYLLLYPTSELKALIERKQGLVNTLWEHLNGYNDDVFISGGRVYGGGLYKMEPRELMGLRLHIGHLL